jgi:DNA-binding transcriptional regulator YdaS (Cro superfamily)
MLNRYLHDKKIKQSEFRRLLLKRAGATVSAPLLSMWCSGQRTPNRKHALAIERTTRGAVRAASWDSVHP